MRQRRLRVRIIGGVWIACLFAAPHALRAAPQIGSGQWENLYALGEQDLVRVELKTGKTIRGKYRSVSPDSIQIKTKAGRTELQREAILRVFVKGKAHRARNALIGTAIGAAAGLGLGALSDRANKCTASGPFLCGGSSNLGKEILVPMGGILGGVIGLVMPAAHWIEIYRAR